MALTAQTVRRHLLTLKDESRAVNSARFFKTGVGEYAEGDQFLGIRVPTLRALVKDNRGLCLAETIKLLPDPLHEIRLFALFLLVDQFARADEEKRTTIYRHYLSNTSSINNWDLVDSSAYQIVGVYLQDKERRPLYRLVASSSLWERRIAMVATYQFIKAGDFADTLKLAERLLNDSEDLIHKAVGWMLREVGKRNLQVEEEFLANHYSAMPRTMLRYAIEKFPQKDRQRYLKGRV